MRVHHWDTFARLISTPLHLHGASNRCNCTNPGVWLARYIVSHISAIRHACGKNWGFIKLEVFYQHVLNSTNEFYVINCRVLEVIVEVQFGSYSSGIPAGYIATKPYCSESGCKPLYCWKYSAWSVYPWKPMTKGCSWLEVWGNVEHKIAFDPINNDSVITAGPLHRLC